MKQKLTFIPASQGTKLLQISIKRILITATLGLIICNAHSQTWIRGVNMGKLTDYLFVFTDGSVDANWQSASKGFIGNVAINGTVAHERTSGQFGYSGTIFTN